MVLRDRLSPSAMRARQDRGAQAVLISKKDQGEVRSATSLEERGQSEGKRWAGRVSPGMRAAGCTDTASEMRKEQQSGEEDPVPTFAWYEVHICFCQEQYLLLQRIHPWPRACLFGYKGSRPLSPLLRLRGHLDTGSRDDLLPLAGRVALHKKQTKFHPHPVKQSPPPPRFLHASSAPLPSSTSTPHLMSGISTRTS